MIEVHALRYACVRNARGTFFQPQLQVTIHYQISTVNALHFILQSERYIYFIVNSMYQSDAPALGRYVYKRIIFI